MICCTGTYYQQSTYYLEWKEKSEMDYKKKVKRRKKETELNLNTIDIIFPTCNNTTTSKIKFIWKLLIWILLLEKIK